MTRIQTVVAALDFSSGSEVALLRAADIAERAGAVLHLLHADVLPRPTGDGEPPDAVPSSVLRVQMERFTAVAFGLPAGDPFALDVLDPTVAVVRGATAPEAILRYVAEVNADLLVLGTRGRSGIARLFLGSVAEACVAGSPCPAVTVPDRALPLAPSPSAPVLVAVDFSAKSRAALAAGHALASLYGAAVEVVHVVRVEPVTSEFAPPPLAAADPAEGRSRLARFAESVLGAAPAAVHVATGRPARLVSEVAAERRAGAVVMGTPGPAGAARALAGSVPLATIRRAPCPVLTVDGPGRPVGERRMAGWAGQSSAA